MYALLADITLSIHALFVVVVVFGLLLIILGGIRKWTWIRSPLIRYIHLAMILVVVSESWLGITCPLTTLENYLRALAGQPGYELSLIGAWLRKILFYHIEEWVFTLVYSLFAVLVVLSLVLFPPLRRRNHTH